MAAPSETLPFRRALAITVVGLSVLCALFLGLGYFQGPKLSSAQVDATAVISQSGQQLRLFANQALTQVEADQVTITPATPITVTTTGSIVAVQFDELLQYATEYRVQVSGITSLYLDQVGSIDYRFTTDSPTLHYLDRGVPDDEIVATGLTGSDRTTLYSAPRIQDFAVLDASLAVVTLADDNTSAIDLVVPATGIVERVQLPDLGSVGSLDSATSGTVIGFTLTSADDGPGQLNSSTLYTVDFSTGRQVEQVKDVDGSALNVLSWQFIPGSSSLLALSISGSLLAIDPVAATVVPLGQFQELGKVSQDGTATTLADAVGQLALGLADGEQQRLDPPLIDGAYSFLGATEVLPGGDRVEKVVVPDATGTRFRSLLVYDDGTSARVLYETANEGGSISDFSVSPNGQYVAIETVPDPAASVFDGYYYDSRATSVTTVIVDLASGAPVRSVEGFRWQW